MKWLISQLLIFILGLILFAPVLLFEIDGITGFLLAAFGVLLMGLCLTLRNVIHFFINLL